MNQKVMRVFAAVLIFGLPALLAAAIMVRAAWFELQIDFRPRVGPVPLPTAPELAGIRTVTIASVDAPPSTAFFRAPTNGRVIVLLHGTGADRAQMVPEAVILARHGYGILALDWPGHGESGGKVCWDEGERFALRRALNWVAAEPGVASDRIGVLGFSMGAWFAIQAAARDTRIKALALTGAFADVRDTFALGRWGWLSSWPAATAARWRGMRPGENRSIDLIGRVAPRPFLLVTGTADRGVPPESTRRLFEAASSPKSWWSVAGAGHGGYAAQDPQEYERRLLALFDEALSPQY